MANMDAFEDQGSIQYRPHADDAWPGYARSRFGQLASTLGIRSQVEGMDKLWLMDILSFLCGKDSKGPAQAGWLSCHIICMKGREGSRPLSKGKSARIT
jgi:hypothetical protein